MHGQRGNKMNAEELIKLMFPGMAVRISQEEKPTLVPEERELAEALSAIAEKYGKFNDDYTGIWAGYEKPENNENASIGVKCSNCVLYQGGTTCKIIAAAVSPEGKCRFAVIPDGLVKK
jgi:hypothetical protein